MAATLATTSGAASAPRVRDYSQGQQLTPDTEITLAFEHDGNRWWLKVDGKRSGYYPDRLWRGRFRGTDFAQLYGEVVTGAKQRVCADMGNGLLARNPKAAYMKDVEWLDGPPVRLHKATTVHEVHPYTYQQTSPNSFRYGGPGVLISPRPAPRGPSRAAPPAAGPASGGA